MADGGSMDFAVLRSALNLLGIPYELRSAPNQEVEPLVIETLVLLGISGACFDERGRLVRTIPSAGSDSAPRRPRSGSRACAPPPDPPRGVSATWREGPRADFTLSILGALVVEATEAEEESRELRQRLIESQEEVDRLRADLGVEKRRSSEIAADLARARALMAAAEQEEETTALQLVEAEGRLAEAEAEAADLRGGAGAGLTIDEMTPGGSLSSPGAGEGAGGDTATTPPAPLSGEDPRRAQVGISVEVHGVRLHGAPPSLGSMVTAAPCSWCSGRPGTMSCRFCGGLGQIPILVPREPIR